MSSVEYLREWMEKRVDFYNRPDFIAEDPIAIPHRFSKRQDIEIAGFWTAVLAWGRRSLIMRKAEELLRRMDNAPYDFILHHTERDKMRLSDFVHRTFQGVDALYFLDFLQYHYRAHDTMESAFLYGKEADWLAREALEQFHRYFFSLPHAPQRTKKHVPTPARGSTCKRLNMFLRWMVRRDDRGVDFGLWRSIPPSRLVIPLDVHVERIARRLGLLRRKSLDWKAVEEVTDFCRQIFPDDPAVCDFALFGAGVLEKGS